MADDLKTIRKKDGLTFPLSLLHWPPETGPSASIRQDQVMCSGNTVGVSNMKAPVSWCLRACEGDRSCDEAFLLRQDRRKGMFGVSHVGSRYC